MAYDVKKITTVVDGQYLTGYSSDSKVKAEKEEDSLIEYIGVDGDVDFSKNANNSGVITITLKSTSPSISYLNRLSNARKVFPISVIDLNENGVNATGTDAFVRKPVLPDNAKEISDVEYEIFVGDLTIE
jgi:hypothetical protein